jgi:hypothetical protein
VDEKSIVSQICDQADDFLAGVTKRDVARAGVSEWLTIHHQKLPPADKKVIVDQVMSILEREEFFATDAGGD